MLSVQETRQNDLLGGILLLGGIFLASAEVSLLLLSLIGWNPLQSPASSWLGIGVTFTVGAAAVYCMLRWAKS